MSDSPKTLKKTPFDQEAEIDELKITQTDLQINQMDLYKSIAVLGERIEGVVEKIELKNKNLADKIESSFTVLSEKMQTNNESNDKIVVKMEQWVDINQVNEKRLEKIEEHVQKRMDRNKAIRNAIWGLLIAAGSVGATKIGEMIFSKIL